MLFCYTVMKMKIAIVGPSHPYKGGISQHTTRLAQHLSDAGNIVEIISWRTQYPFFYPGIKTVPNNQPEQPLFKTNRRVMSWKNPLGWIVWARYLRQFDKVIFIWWVPTIQGPIYYSMIKAMGKTRPEIELICHNIVSHSASPLDRKFTSKVFNVVDKLIVHTKDMAKQARSFTSNPIDVVKMPAHLPGNPKLQDNTLGLNNSLLFFGMVRHYKGVDILIQALAKTPGVKLVVAGEMWGSQETKLRSQIKGLNLTDRIKLLPSYVAVEDIPKLFADCDAIVMPYRSGTASQTAEMAFAYGRPVISTNVGSMPSQIKNKINGILCAANDVESLTEAIMFFYKPGVAKKLRDNIVQIDPENDWRRYIQVLIK